MTYTHVYAAKMQPATAFKVDLGGKPHVCKNPSRRLFPCFRCRRKRWAINMTVQVYYDGCYFWCKDMAACKAFKKAQGRKRYQRRKERAATAQARIAKAARAIDRFYRRDKLP